MSVDYNVYIGAYVECRGPNKLASGDMWENIEHDLYEARDMCAGGLVKGAHVFLPNFEAKHAIHISPGREDCGVSYGIPDNDLAKREIEQRCIESLAVLRRAFRSVELRLGILYWASY